MLRHGRPLLYGQTENQAELSSPSASAAGSGSPASRCVYEYAIDQFIAWYCSAPRLAFNRIVVVRYRMYLETRGLAANTINQQLAACTAWLTKPPIQAFAQSRAGCGNQGSKRGEAARLPLRQLVDR